jgi:hypothetical protein
MKRDQNLIFNKQCIKRDPLNNFLREWTKIKHITKITTFSKKKVTMYRLIDLGVNKVLVVMHILKAGSKFNENDPFELLTTEFT